MNETGDLNGKPTKLVLPFDDSALWILDYLWGAYASLLWNNSWQQVGTATVQDTSEVYTKAMKGSYILMDYGSIVPFIGEDIPDHLLICDGSTYDREDYPELHRVLPPAMKTADFFTLPDLRDKFLLGGSLVDVGTTGGESEHTLTADEMPNHSHTSPPHSHSYTSPFVIASPEGGGAPIPALATTPAISGSTSVSIDSTGGGQAHNNMPPYYTLVYCVVAK